jgi:ribosomal protein S18 acetylase RimI-like enzyme
MMLLRRSRHPPAHLSALLLVLVFLSLPGPSSSLSLGRNYSATATTTTSTTRGVAGRDVVVRIASVPVDLPLIRDCRRSAYAGKSVNLPAARSFCEADQITREGYVCVIATESGSVLGTADLNMKTGVVNNVYVRDEARKRGIARSMMVAVEEYYGGGVSDGNDGNGRGRGRRRKLALTVMSKNLPAVNLYKGLGYKAPGVYGGLDAISTFSPLNFLIEMEKEI